MENEFQNTGFSWGGFWKLELVRVFLVGLNLFLVFEASSHFQERILQNFFKL